MQSRFTLGAAHERLKPNEVDWSFFHFGTPTSFYFIYLCLDKIVRTFMEQ